MAILVLLSLSITTSFAQDKDLVMEKSNDLVYEGNSLVNDDFVSAEKEYRKAISKAPTNNIGSYNLGHAYYKSGHFDEALLRNIEATKNAESKSEKHKAFHNIGNILMQKNMCKEAVEAFKNALRNDPTDDESRYNLALAKECAKQQGEGDGDDKDEKDEDEKKDDENKDNEENKDDGDNNEDKESEGDDKEEQKEGDDQDDEDGKPKDEKDNKEENKPGDKKKKQQQQPGKLSPQQVRNLLEAMNNQEKKVQEKINAQKMKGAKVRNEKDW